MKEWDAFIQKRRISSEAFIGRAVVECVNEKLHWLLESKTRSQEFGKHLSALIARGLDDETIQSINVRLQDGKWHQKPAGNAADTTSATDAANVALQHNSQGCAVCGRVVRGPQLLVCANDVSLFVLLVHYLGIRKLANKCLMNRTVKTHCTTTSACGIRR